VSAETISRKANSIPSFLKQIRGLRGKEAQTAEKALPAFDRFAETGEKAEGLGFKKIAAGKFEIRVDIRMRTVMKKIGPDYHLAHYGDHRAIERFLRRH